MTDDGAWDFEVRELPYRAQLRQAALRLTRGADGADDLLQETYLKAYRHYVGLRRQQPQGLAAQDPQEHVHQRDRRRRSRSPWSFELVAETLGFGSHRRQRSDDSDPRGRGRRGSPGMARFWWALAALLPHNFRVAVLLADIEGNDLTREVAAILSIRSGTVMLRRLFRGRRLLERALLAFGVR